MSAAVPTLETARLRLRPPRAADFDAVAAFLASERAKYMGGPYGARQAWRNFAETCGSRMLRGYGYWAVETREGALAGAVGVIGPPAMPEPELGWELHGGYEGSGYATEAARAARDWWFGPFGGATLVSYIGPLNTRSIRVAERLGAVRDPWAFRDDPEDIVFRHPRPERAA